MSTNPGRTVYIGGLDERVNDRVLYDILIQAGRVVDLYIPRNKETGRPRGFAFAEYEREEIAEYAVKLFTGLVTIYNRTLKFAISGQDKPSQDLPMSHTPTVKSTSNARPPQVPHNVIMQDITPQPPQIQHKVTDVSPHFMRLSAPSCRLSEQQSNYAQGHNYSSHYANNGSCYGGRVYGTILDNSTRSRSRFYDTS